MSAFFARFATSADERIAPWYRCLVALFGLALLAVTWRLWTPQTVFPQVPLVGVAGRLPPWFDLLALLGMVCGLLLEFTPQRKRFGWLAFSVALAVAVVIDQHRLQPWAWQLLILGCVFVVTPAGRQPALARLLTISVYFHSAHSKLDAAFFHEQGPRILSGLAGALGVDTTWWSEATQAWAAATFPLGELVVAVLLFVPRTRRAGGALAVLMHVALLLAFGPWGLDHEWGVLLWNGLFLTQAVLLFGLPRSGPRGERTSKASSTAGEERIGAGAGEVVVTMAVLLPFLEPPGWFDHWPAWAVYSARTENVRVSIPAEARPQVPDHVRPFVDEPGFEGWCRVRVDRWSLEALGVPVYPQERFRVGVALSVADWPGVEGDVRVVVEGLPDRWTGERASVTLEGREALRRRAQQFFWNAAPR